MREQLYRSLTPVSTAATMASSTLDTSGSNHTYEPIETAQAMLNSGTTSGQAFNNNNNNNTAQQQQHPVTLIHHDGRRVTTNRIVSLESLREVLLEHEKVPYDDPECRGDLYILAPMRLLTPVIEETESEFTRSRLYQSILTQGSAHNYQPANYSDVDTSIMSIISEVLNVRSSAAAAASSQPRRTAAAAPAATQECERVDTSSLLHTIEEIRNSSLCNLYYSSTPTGGPQQQQQEGRLLPPPLPTVPPRDTVGYASLCKENKESKAAATTRHDIHSSRGLVSPPSPLPPPPLNESIRSVDSNTLVVTPPTVKKQRSKKKLSLSPANGRLGGGCRKNILDLVGGEGTANILNTPKTVKGAEKLALAADAHNLLSDSLASETNEFRALMPHLTNTGAKFLSRVVKAAGGVTAGLGAADSDLDASHNFPPPPQRRRSSLSADVMSNFSPETPSPKQFVRHFSGNNNKNQKALPPRRKFSLVRPRFDSSCSGGAESGTSDDGENSDIKYGFMPPEHPDAKYGFGVFGEMSAAATGHGYNVVETAKLCNNSATRNHFQPPRPSLLASTSTPKADSGTGFILPPSAASTVYSLSALNKADTAFKLNPEDQYEKRHQFSNIPPRNSWQSASLHQRRPFDDHGSDNGGDAVDFAIGQRTDAGRRSMSILDDFLEEKENVRRVPPPPPPCTVSNRQQLPKRRPLAVLNKTSPMKILGNNLRHHSPQARVYRLNEMGPTGKMAAKSKLFGKRSES